MGKQPRSTSDGDGRLDASGDTPGLNQRLTQLRRLATRVKWGRLLGDLAAAITFSFAVFVGVVMIGLVIGYRPLAIQGGAMGDAVPDRALLVAKPIDGADLRVGDIVVVRRPGVATAARRIIEIEPQGSTLFATTQGDALGAPDAAPFALDGQHLVSRWVFPGVGASLSILSEPTFLLDLVNLSLVVLAIPALGWIWRSRHHPIGAGRKGSAAPRQPWRQVRVAALLVPLIGVLSGGVAAALFTANEAVPGNAFGARDCFDPQLSSVQSGQSVHSTNGVLTVGITTVDPASSFVFASVRSASNEPADSTVQTVLASDGSSIELTRNTDAGVPPSLTVSWSVVEYSCGVSVQRGTVAGNGTNQLNVAISSADPAASFVLASTSAESTASGFDGNDLFIAELTNSTSLRIRSASNLNAQQSFAWQVVTFADTADIAVQTVSTTMGSGVGSADVAIPTAVDLDTTFLITGATSTASGADIGERMIRSHLVGDTTVALRRSVNGDAIDVQVQVVTLKDGSVVKHGTVDFATGQATKTISVDPVDTSRATAMSTTAIPGVSAGGQSDHIADDVIGEATATFTISDARTLTVERASTASNASFGWQLIEWAGPRWWDADYTFRQRIDVDTTTVAAPNGYTVPVTFDHGALVSSGLARPDGTDVRVLRWDGSAWNELDRILNDGSSWNQAATTISFRTADTIETASAGTYWLYFGNETPAAVADDPENVFLLVEDFDSATLGDFEDRTGGSAWYTADPWTRRIPVTVAASTVGSDLTDFALLVSVTAADLGSNALADGSDIRFTASDGTTALAHEIESWTPGSGSLEAWVKVPVVASASPTVIYLYYGAANAPAQADVRNTWPAEVEAAWHMDRDPSGAAPQIDDSSPNNHDGLSGGSMTSGDLVPGLVGEAVDFDGSDDVLQTDSFDLAGSDELTLSGWVNLDSTAANGRVVAKAADSTDQIVELTVTSTDGVRARLSLDGSTVQVEGGLGSIALATWHHVAASWDGANLAVYLDGVQVGSVAASGLLDTDLTMPVTVGNVITQDGAIDGRLDEVRIETVARSADWLSATEANHRNPGSFAVAGSPETGTWFSQGTWAARKPIVVDAEQVVSDLSDFALLVQLTDTDIQAGALATGADLVFTAADGTTRLDHVVEAYDGGTGALSAWVSVPLVSSSVDTELFVYYSNPSAADQQDPQGVFGPQSDLALLGTP